MLALLLLVGGVIWNQEDWDDLLSDKIMNLSVHPDYRGNGYAHNLMALVKEELESSQLKRICAGGRVVVELSVLNILFTLGNIALWIFILIFLIKLIKRNK